MDNPIDNNARQKAYEERGCANRKEYLAMLAEEEGVDLETVTAIADVLGPNEDFDGLVTQVQDAAEG